MKKKRLDADLLNSVAESAGNLAVSTNKAAKEVKNLGKKLNKAKNHKAIVSASEMIGTTLYKSLSDSLLYRRLKSSGPVEKMVAGVWKEVNMDFNFLTNERFKEY